MAEGTAGKYNGKGLTGMYGVNNSVNFPNSYNYGKNNAQAQSPYEQRSTSTTRSAMRADEILFSAVASKENPAVASLSEDAKNLLLELKEKYKGYDFMVGDYETDDEASRLLSGGKGEINVLITPALLEEMAANKSVRTKYEKIIAGAQDQFRQIESKLTTEGKSILGKLGLTVNEDGTFNFFAGLIDGVKTEDGKDFVKSSLVKDLTDMVNTLAKSRDKMIESSGNKDDKPVDKEEEKKKSVLPPKSFEKYEKEESPYSTEEDFGNLPPESFEKYRQKEDPYSSEEDYGTLPPESFKKYQTESGDGIKEAGAEMNYSI